MQKWLRISLLVCTFGFLREMRPSEPFVVEYLTSDQWRNITNEQLNKEVYPFGTYATLAQLVIVFLITDILHYKPIIVISACAGIVLFSILLWTKSLLELQIGQLFYGTFMASEVAYYTYIYAKVEKSRYHNVTGHTRAAILCGKFLGGLLAQLLVSTKTMNYRELHYISFGSQVVSLLVALALPAVNKSLYFYPEKHVQTVVSTYGTESVEDIHVKMDAEETVAPTAAVPEFSWRNAIQLLLSHIINAYSNPIVLQWSIWWALATCGQLQVISYVQFLWKDIDPEHINFYNGAVEAAVTFLGAVSAFAAGLVKSKQNRWHWWILTVSSLLMGAFLVVSAFTNIIWVAYAMYILFGIAYFFVITVANAEVAKNISNDSFGLIFGINTLVALFLQTALTLCVVTDNGFGLASRAQYLVYGGYFILLSALYCVIAFTKFILICCKSKILLK